MGEELENLALQCLIRGEGAKVVENLADRNFLVFFCGNCWVWTICDHHPHLLSDREVGEESRAKSCDEQRCAAFPEVYSCSEYDPKILSLVSDRAVRGVFFAPLIKGGHGWGIGSRQIV